MTDDLLCASAPQAYWVADAMAAARGPLARYMPAARPELAIAGGVAMIGVHGALLPKLPGFDPIGGCTGINQVRARLLLAADTPAVRAIALDFDSMGGTIDGVLSLADLIRDLSRDKPVWAICSDRALGSAYVLASACSRVTVPRTGGVGGIGVVAAVFDSSAALAAAGIAVHFIVHGRRKAEEMRAEVAGVEPGMLKRLQERVDYIGDLLDGAVARFRKRSVKQIAALNGADFMGAASVKAGLADAVVAPSEAFGELAQLARETRRRSV